MTGDRLAGLLDPAHCAVLTMELQRGVVGDGSPFPDLVEAVRAGGVIERAARVCGAARRAGVRVVHATAEERADGAGQSANCRILAMTAKRRVGGQPGAVDRGTPGAALVDELGAGATDIVVARMHGLTPFTATELDPVLRNLGVRSIVLMGVSLNVGVMGAALSAVDLGYHVVLVADAVAAVPPAYADWVIEHTMANIATVVQSTDVLEVWRAQGT